MALKAAVEAVEARRASSPGEPRCSPQCSQEGFFVLEPLGVLTAAFGLSLEPPRGLGGFLLSGFTSGDTVGATIATEGGEGGFTMTVGAAAGGEISAACGIGSGLSCTGACAASIESPPRPR
jgi:hypothetical protein